MALEDRVTMLEQMTLEDDQQVIEGNSAALLYVSEAVSEYSDIASFKTKWIEEAPFIKQMVFSFLFSLFSLFLLIFSLSFFPFFFPSKETMSSRRKRIHAYGLHLSISGQAMSSTQDD